ncbi:MAG: ferrous iron transporter B [Clostridia bacterium]|nr:ferrous iron transporter B [Clostridia bacterium]
MPSAEKKTINVALAGNPNVGKSTVFNNLTGMKQHTGNWPGKTVATAKGFSESEKYIYSVVDLPGTYSLSSHSPEEEIASEYLTSGCCDAVVIVCDAACLERNLILAFQIMNLGIRAILCVNLLDEAKRKGINVDLDLLSKKLGVPVVGTVGRKKKSAQKILDALDDLSYGESLSAENLHFSENNIEEIIAKSEEAVKEAVTKKHENTFGFDRKLDRILTGKLTAYPIMILLLAAVFWITLEGANYPSRLLAVVLDNLGEGIRSFLEFVRIPNIIISVFIDGIYRVLSSVVSVMLPPMAIFFPFFTLLEDSGYLPRIAYNLDRPFKCSGACGKQALTMCMGFGCNAAGVVGCRIIDSPRERLLAVLTNSLVPCNGKFPTLIALISMFFVLDGNFSAMLSSLILTLVILLGIAMTFAATRILSFTCLKGRPSSFILELPSYRKPQIGKVIVRSLLDRTASVLMRAIAFSAPCGLVIWMLANISIGDTSLLSSCTIFFDPIGKALGLDGVIIFAFILGLPANEIVIPIILMSYLSSGTLVDISDLDSMKNILVSNGWTLKTAISMTIFTLFHWPCATTLITVKKETGKLYYTLLSAMIPTLIGVILCLMVNILF